MTGWRNEPRPHYYREVGEAVLALLKEKALYPEEITPDALGCADCQQSKEDHTDPIPPEVELRQAEVNGQIQRLEGF